MDNKRGYSWEVARMMLATALGCSIKVAEELMEKMEGELNAKE